MTYRERQAEAAKARKILREQRIREAKKSFAAAYNREEQPSTKTKAVEAFKESYSRD